jgi:hypothetical protein
MRVLRATEIEGRRHDQVVPREGTYARQLFDILTVNKGTPVELPASSRVGSTVDNLDTIYSLKAKVKRRQHHPSLFTLVGQWSGKCRVSWVKEAI